MNINPCDATSTEALTAFALGVVSVYSISLLAILLTYYLCRSRVTAGPEKSKWTPWYHLYVRSMREKS